MKVIYQYHISIVIYQYHFCRVTGFSWPTVTCRWVGCLSLTSWWNSFRWRSRTRTSDCGWVAALIQSSPSPSYKSALRWQRSLQRLVVTFVTSLHRRSSKNVTRDASWRTIFFFQTVKLSRATSWSREVFSLLSKPYCYFIISPQGLKANMKRLYQLITEQQFSRCHKQDKYKKLLFSLCFFHSVLLERRKFLMLGWNIQYGFNDSDFEVSENLLSIYLDEYEETPWDALKYLVSENFLATV